MTEVQTTKLDRAREIVGEARRVGAAKVEVYMVSSQELSVDISNGAVETMKLAGEAGLGVRLINEGRLGFAYSSDLSGGSVHKIIDQALANSKLTAVDEFLQLPKPGFQYPSLDLFDPGIREASVEDKIELAKTIEAKARAYDPRVTITERSSYFDATYEVAVANSEGVAESYQGSYCGAYAYLVAEENGDSQTGFGVQYSLRYDRLDPVAIGREAAEKAVRMLGAKPVATQKATLVFDPHIVTNFLGVIGPALTGEAVQKGKSLFAGKTGQSVASDKVTIIDDGTMVDGINAAPFDGEGVPTGKTVLIDRGNLQAFLHNTYTAAKDGVSSTGNGVRGSFKSTPEVGTTNFYMAPGHRSREALINDVQSGLYVTDVMGMHTANPISGDFSVGVSGIWIKNGLFTTPVRGVAIAGNILDFLRSVEDVADDLHFFGGKGAPTIRIAGVTISGS